MKIDLKKFRNGVSTVVRKQISFLCCAFRRFFIFLKYEFLSLVVRK